MQSNCYLVPKRKHGYHMVAFCASKHFHKSTSIGPQNVMMLFMIAKYCELCWRNFKIKSSWFCTWIFISITASTQHHASVRSFSKKKNHLPKKLIDIREKRCITTQASTRRPKYLRIIGEYLGESGESFWSRARTWKNSHMHDDSVKQNIQCFALQ